jgi:hypothetical protein
MTTIVNGITVFAEGSLTGMRAAEKLSFNRKNQPA